MTNGGQRVKKVIGIVRYSVLAPDRPDFRLSKGRNSFEKYRDKVFAPDQLRMREFLFSNVTVPSLSEQESVASDVDFRLAVLTSEELPQRNKEFLYDLARAYPWLDVLECPVAKDPFAPVLGPYLSTMVPAGSSYATFTVDDDDAVSKHFLARLLESTRCGLTEYAVSFGRGFTGLLNSANRTIDFVCETWSPKIAIGLALCTQRRAEGDDPGSFPHVFALGRHFHIDKNVPVLLDSRTPMYLRIVHAYSSTMHSKGPLSRHIARRRWMNRPGRTSPKEVCKEIGISESLFSYDEHVPQDRTWRAMRAVRDTARRSLRKL